MSLVRLQLALVGLALFVPVIASGAADEREDRLSEEHRRWLEEEVVYIISEREREGFLDLETRDEYDRFIEAFWNTSSVCSHLRRCG